MSILYISPFVASVLTDGVLCCDQAYVFKYPSLSIFTRVQHAHIILFLTRVTCLIIHHTCTTCSHFIIPNIHYMCTTCSHLSLFHDINVATLTSNNISHNSGNVAMKSIKLIIFNWTHFVVGQKVQTVFVRLNKTNGIKINVSLLKNNNHHGNFLPHVLCFMLSTMLSNSGPVLIPSQIQI